MSTGVINLTSSSFHIERGRRGNLLCTNIPGVSMVVFVAPGCSHCDALMPSYHTLPGSNGTLGCKFAVVNVGTEREVVNLSRQTIMPVEHVPILVVFINGRPYMEYNGERNAQAIRDFIIPIMNRFQPSQSFMRQRPGSSSQEMPEAQPKPKKRDANTLGIPYNTTGSNYSTFDDAYNTI